MSRGHYDVGLDAPRQLLLHNHPAGGSDADLLPEAGVRLEDALGCGELQIKFVALGERVFHRDLSVLIHAWSSVVQA